MYSEKIQEIIDESGAEIGDRVKVEGKEGRLMPKPESGDPDSLVLKLDSGYNIGVKPEEIELVEKRDEETREKMEVEHSEDRPDILVLHTGGTIASRVSYEEGGVKPAFDPEDLLEMYPELGEEVNLHSEVVAQMLSEDMEPEHWQEIAEKIHEVKDDYDGIIVGHGTDTMAFTGAALSFMLNGIDQGVMLVGSQRSSDRPSSDASINLYSASKFLTETEFTGIGVCMHESTSDNLCNILPAHKVRKMHTSRRDAFSAINAEPLGRVNYETGEVELERNPETGKGEYNYRPELDTEVGYIKARPGMETAEVEFLESQNYSGIVIEGTGLGHMPVNAFDDKTQHHADILEKVGELAEDSAVVLASQCLNGRTDMDVYDAGIKIKDAGVVEAKDMHPELAYVKLMWSIGQAEDLDKARELFKENVAGELQERSVYSE